MQYNTGTIRAYTQRENFYVIEKNFPQDINVQ